MMVIISVCPWYSASKLPSWYIHSSQSGFTVLVLFCQFYVAPTLYRLYGDIPALTCGGRPQVPFGALFQALAGT